MSFTGTLGNLNPHWLTLQKKIISISFMKENPSDLCAMMFDIFSPKEIIVSNKQADFAAYYIDGPGMRVARKRPRNLGHSQSSLNTLSKRFIDDMLQ